MLLPVVLYRTQEGGRDKGKVNLDDAYYELCEWRRARPAAVRAVVDEM